MCSYKVRFTKLYIIYKTNFINLNSAALFFVRYFYILKRYFGINPLIWDFSGVLGSCIGIKSPTQTQWGI